MHNLKGCPNYTFNRCVWYAGHTLRIAGHFAICRWIKRLWVDGATGGASGLAKAGLQVSNRACQHLRDGGLAPAGRANASSLMNCSHQFSVHLGQISILSIFRPTESSGRIALGVDAKSTGSIVPNLSTTCDGIGSGDFNTVGGNAAEIRDVMEFESFQISAIDAGSPLAVPASKKSRLVPEMSIPHGVCAETYSLQVRR